MVRLLLLCVALLTPSVPAAAQGQTDASAIESVIQRQIDAFLVDDFETAFSFASPAIKGIFGDHERFGTMVRNGYPMVWRPSEVHFLELEARGGRQHQKVMVKDASGTLWMLDYEMVDTTDGWQINGVRVLRAPEVGA